MNEYHKIQTVFLRDPETKSLLAGSWALPEFEYLQCNEWEFTEKVDGTNIRIMVKPEGITFGGRTDNASIPAFLVTKLEHRFLPYTIKLQEMFPKGACLYGEGYGARIQKGGGNYRQDQDFVLFDIKVGDWWLQRPDVANIAEGLAIEIVPVVDQGNLHDMVALVSNGFDSNWGPFPAEGVVARPMVELKSRSERRIITKLKTKDFTT